jgi:hypothetical protein
VIEEIRRNQPTTLSGEIVPRQFRATVALTPGRPFCEGGQRLFQVSPDLWKHPTWRALDFAVEVPHPYKYEYVSSGVGDNAMFTARAIGDLNCDGVFSTFERMGTIDPEINPL